jgi:hypothetical protein
MGMIPEDIVLTAWTYGADDPFLSYFMPFIEGGFDFMFSCGVLNSNRLLPDYRMKYDSPIFSKIDLAAVYEENTRVVAYAYCRIESPAEQSVRATFGSNDGIQLILNGDRIYKKFMKRSLIIDEDEVLLPLKKGRNDLLVKIDQNKGGWGFSFRLPDVSVRNHKHKYRIVN